MSSQKECPSCRQPVDEWSDFCPNCGRLQGKERRSIGCAIGLGVGAVLFALMGACAANEYVAHPHQDLIGVVQAFAFLAFGASAILALGAIFVGTKR